MTSQSNELIDAILAQNVAEARTHFYQTEFVLIKVSDSEQEEDDHLGALTANVEDFDVLVVFTNEQFATDFVGKMGELFEEDEEIEGFFVDGDAILEYLPEEFGLLINPEHEPTAVMQPSLLAQIRDPE